MNNIVFTEAALADIEQAIEWYLERSEQVAHGFNQALADGVASIRSHPERWAKCDAKHRFYLLKKYPYSVIYRMHEKTIEIVAVAHAKRRPNYWTKK